MERILRPSVAWLAIGIAAATAAAAAPKGVGKWAREKGYYQTVQAHILPIANFTVTRLSDGTMIVIYGRGYVERPPGSHLWTQHLPPRHSGNLWLWQCVGGNPHHLFFIAKAGPHWGTTWLCTVRPKQQARMLLELRGNGSSATFASGRMGAFALGSHLVLTVDGGRRWLPQPKLGAGRLYRLKWLRADRLLVAGVKAVLLLRVSADGSIKVLARSTPVPPKSAVGQYQLVRFGWPYSWWAAYSRDLKKRSVLKLFDLQMGKVLARYPVPQASAFVPFHGGFIAVTPRGQMDNWLEIYRRRGGRAVLEHKAKADYWATLEWRPHGRFVFGGNRKQGLYQLDVHTGVIKPTSIRLKKWIVPPDPNSPQVIIHSKAWLKAIAALIRGTSTLKGAYKQRFFHDFFKRGRPGADPWKWMKTNMDEIKKLYAEQEKAAGK